MSIRKIIFCDICNPRGLKTVEFRRMRRENDNAGRRITEGRAWIEGDIDDAAKNGWLCTPGGRHICPACRIRLDSCDADARLHVENKDGTNYRWC